ncbi:MAG: hypothetical protein AABX70_08070 [Nanoarchaeota archaeon]
MTKRGQGDSSFTTILFFGVFFISLIGLGYYFFYDTGRFGNDKCVFTKVFSCREATLAPDGVHLELINMYGMDIKALSITIETLNKSSISCTETQLVGDLGNSVPTGKKIFCKPSTPYEVGALIDAKLKGNFQDPLLSFNDRTVHGELKLRLRSNESTWWDKVFS